MFMLVTTALYVDGADAMAVEGLGWYRLFVEGTLCLSNCTTSSLMAALV